MSQAHATLRSATARHHAVTEDAFAGFDLAAPQGYRAFLRAQAAAVLPAEGWLDRMSVARVLPDWGARRRGDLLVADLRALHVGTPEWIEAELPGDPLGVVYVLEGSRFGARLLARRAWSGEAASRFLRDPGVADGWRGLWDVVDGEIAAGRRTFGGLIEAAEATFALFRSAATREALQSSGNRDDDAVRSCAAQAGW